MLKKIVVIGPESTGKSTLCKQLAAHYNTLWVPEYAREYLEKNGTNYTYDDLLIIAKGQVASEEAIGNRQKAIGNERTNPQPVTRNSPLTTHHSPLTTHNSLLFIDTDMYVMKVWYEFVFGKCESWILNEIVKRKYDLYLLCNPDLPWVQDELREYPDLKTREKLYHFYKDHLVNQNTPWVEVKGNYEERLGIAIKAVDSLNRNF